MSKVPARNDGPEPSGSGLYSQLQSVSRRTLGYVQDIARSLVLATLSSCESGTLHIHEPSRSEKTTTVGSIGQNDSLASLTIHDDFFWVRILLSGDIGFAQSYMLHEISSPDLTALFAFFIRNGSSMSSATTYGTAWVVDRAIRSVAGATNNIATAKLNANSHYSLSNDMFAAFLSPDMTYSAPLWLPASDPGAARDTLEEAQMRKLQYAIDQTHIKAADHVLEVGTGWGSFSILAARTTGCRVTTITPSREQKKLAEEHIAEAGLSDRIEVLLADYRELRPERPFDKIVSIEMIEHVGHRYLDTYFACMDRYLKRDGGIAYFQCITIPEARYAEYLKGQDFIKKYIFPGGHLPTNSGLVGSIDRASRGKLVVDEIKSFGGHYSKALRCWNEKFQANFESEIAPGLRKSFPEMTRADLDIFRRKWEYYFCYCEAGFSSKILGDVGITVAREGAVELLEGLP